MSKEAAPLAQSSTEAPVLTSVDGPIAVIRLNRPKQLNVLDIAMGEGLLAALRRIAADATIRVVVLAGAGRSFMAGGDLTLFHRDPEKAPAAATQLIDLFHAAMLAIRQMPQPVIAALQGPVAGGGLGLALACDLGVAADDASFLSAYTKIGTSPDGGTTWSLTRLLGARRAMEVMLLNEPMDAHTALALGLVNRVVPAGDVEAEALAMARKIAGGAHGATAAVKRLVGAAVTADFAEQLAAEKVSFIERAATADFREGIAAFLERRTPRFEP
ncbi:enoyl-CoA hydratase/isomerase family protein [Phreatobacter stygius]|uniref:Enoyl-CoA hydratase n=1 Tax=Phreatobacter stygius TaxID=1940610 RepID=A0A4D7AZL9_9HYPH|nr:enoyl-CoA hydratase-related protein [Phreatobacter stygius]QCI64795.1 enoyl-CoA hydratase [Phreatobacter stygius]